MNALKEYTARRFIEPEKLVKELVSLKKKK